MCGYGSRQAIQSLAKIHLELGFLEILHITLSWILVQLAGKVKKFAGFAKRADIQNA